MWKENKDEGFVDCQQQDTFIDGSAQLVLSVNKQMLPLVKYLTLRATYSIRDAGCLLFVTWLPPPESESLNALGQVQVRNTSLLLLWRVQSSCPR